jgi:hypothetical protein
MAKKKVDPNEPVLGTAAAGDPNNPEAGVDTDRLAEPVTNPDAYDGAEGDKGADGDQGKGEDKAK